MKIAFLLSSLKIGGGEIVALTLARSLSKRGHQVVFLLMKSTGELLDDAQRNYTVIDLNCDRTFKLPLRLFHYARLAKPDVIVASYFKLNICACVARLFNPSFKLYLWEHSRFVKEAGMNLAFLFFANIGYQISSGIIAVSNAVASDIAKNTFLLKSKVSVINNPINFPDGILLKDSSKPLTKLLWIGRVQEGKSPHTSLEILRHLYTKDNFTLDIIGDGPLLSDLKIQAHLMGLSNCVTFHGYSSNVFALAASCDILLVTSRLEGFCNAAAEALYSGLLVVTTNCGGILDIVTHGVNGYVSNSFEPSELADIILKVYKHPLDRHMQRLSVLNFTPSVILDRFLAVIQ